MTTDSNPISEGDCHDWRLAYHDGQSPYEIATLWDIHREAVLLHLVGECDHSEDVDPISSGRTHRVSAHECRDIRDQYAAETSIGALEESTGRRWKTLITHLTGQCSHDRQVEAPTVEKEGLLARDTIKPADCARFRRGVREAGNVMAFANMGDTDYPVILAHVNGECSHDIDEPPRTPNERSRAISQEQCRQLRQEYRASPDADTAELAEEYNCSRGTVERHVMFRCSHGPSDMLVTDVDAVQDLLTDESRLNGENERLTPEDITHLDCVENGDPKEASQDLAQPPPDRVQTTRSRIIRNTELGYEMKEMYEYECQVCGDARRGPDGSPYAEIHHIRPLGSPHDGPDTPGNILVLCPNHHADFDYGRLTVDQGTDTVSHTYEPAVDGAKLTVDTAHDINPDHLDYHNDNIAGE